MDITQTPPPQAQQNVGLKVVKTNGESQIDNTESVVDKLKQQQLEAASQNQQSEESSEKVKEDLTRHVKQMNEFIQSVQRDLKFSVDDESGKTIVKIYNTQTNELVRQIPSAEALKLAERIRAGKENGTSGYILKVEV
jgi:flagellar protein FlaG